MGRCPWRDLELWVSPDALIPRQETELLVDLAVARGLASPAPQWGRGRIWADLGTGSGAIGSRFGASLSGWQGHAVDCSAAALALARRNLEAWADGMAWQLHRGQLVAAVAALVGAVGSWWYQTRLTSLRGWWINWIPSCVITSRVWPLMVVQMDWIAAVCCWMALLKLWLRGDGCCWSITTIKARRCWH